MVNASAHGYALRAGLVLALPLAAARADMALVAGTDEGVAGQVRTFDAAGSPLLTLTPYGAFSGGVRVAAGDLTGDGRADVITGAGAGGGGGHVKVFDGVTGSEARSFFSYTPSFTGGVYVASGDVNGDGRDDIITGAGAGGPGGHVKVFDGQTGGEVRSFFAFDAGFTGGVSVATGDVNGDGWDDIIAGTGAGGPGGHVKVFDGRTGGELRSIFAFDPGFTGGVFVGSGDVNGDGLDDIVTGAGAGGGPHVRVFSGATGAELASFSAFSPTFTGGVRVAAGDVNGDGVVELAAALGSPGNGALSVLKADGGAVSTFQPFGPSFTGGIFVAAVPEPGTGVGMAAGLAALLGAAGTRRRG